MFSLICLTRRRIEFPSNYEIMERKEFIKKMELEYGLDASVSSIIWTILFNDGKELSEINDINDAIIHGRSGTGKAVPAGQGLFAEMKDHKSYKNTITSQTGAVAIEIQNAIKKRRSLAGEVTSMSIPVGCLSCQTLGSYCPTNHYANVEYTIKDGHCTANAEIHLEGVDPWDFEGNEGYTWFQNLIREYIPEMLVKLRGEFKPFDITYNLVDKVTYEFDI